MGLIGHSTESILLPARYTVGSRNKLLRSVLRGLCWLRNRHACWDSQTSLVSLVGQGSLLSDWHPANRHLRIRELSTRMCRVRHPTCRGHRSLRWRFNNLGGWRL